MLRIFRIEKSRLSAKTLRYVELSDRWHDELRQALGEEDSGIIASAVERDDFVNFYTIRQGAVSDFPSEESSAPKKTQETLNGQRKRLEEYLSSGSPLADSALEANRQDLLDLVREGQHKVLIDGDVPVIIPAQTIEEESAAAARKASEAALTRKVLKKKHSSGLLKFLGLLGLLVLLIFLLWYFLLRPWPMEGTLKGRINSLLNDMGFNSLFREDYSESIAKHEEILKSAQELLDRMAEDRAAEQAELEKQKALEDEEEARRLKELEEEKQKALEELKKAEEEKNALEAEKKAAEEALLKSEEEKKAAEEARLKAEAEKKAAEEARLKSLEEKKRREAQEKAEAARKETASAQGQKRVPKCETLKKEGKMPKMVIAFDGSESMLIPDVAGSRGLSTRLSAATYAANNMINSIDKNVDIGFVEINGCPAAKNHGFFSGNQRATLRGQINSINPMRYGGMTPLVNGINQMEKMVDGVNAEAVGVLISDGKDTCDGTRSVNVCEMARRLHKRKPLLKIHAILIGQDAMQAACIATITGGRVFSPKNASQINEQLKAAGAEFSKVCN